MMRCYIGGTDKQRTIEKLKTQPHIVVGTPGRIKDLMSEKALFVHTAEILVVDEADMMLDMGFIEDVDQIAGKNARKIANACFLRNDSGKVKTIFEKVYGKSKIYSN